MFIEMAKPDVWNATKIDDANYCRMRFYLKHVEHVPQDFISAYAKGSLLHHIIENFWYNLGSKEEVERDEKSRKKASDKKRYYDPLTFSQYAAKQWNRIAFADRAKEEKLQKLYSISKPSEYERKEIKDTQKNKIVWAYDTEKYIIKNQIPKIAFQLFNVLLEEGPPLFSEHSFKFSIEGLILGGERIGKIEFNGRIDDVRKKDGLYVRDYKSGKPWLGEMKLKHDPQLTFYNLSICTRAFMDEKFAKEVGMEEVRGKFMGNPNFVWEDMKVEYFMMEALLKKAEADEIIAGGKKPKFTVPNTINTSKRTDEDFFDLMQMIEGTKRDVRDGNIYKESGKKCDICSVKRICDQKKTRNDGTPYLDTKSNQTFEFYRPPYERSVTLDPENKSLLVSLDKPEEQKTEGKQKIFAWGRGQNTVKGRIPKDKED